MHEHRDSRSSDASATAINFIKKNRRALLERFASLTKYPTIDVDKPPAVAYFMAGSPGAGKTEWALRGIADLQEGNPFRPIVVIDADVIRGTIPGYNDSIAEEFQGAAALGVQKLLEHVLDNNLDFLLDATFSSPKFRENVRRCLDDGRLVGIFYIYEDPIKAWEYVKQRGRVVPKGEFIRAFIGARENVRKIKEEFGDDVLVTVIIKGQEGQQDEYLDLDGESVDTYFSQTYSPTELEELLKD